MVPAITEPGRSFKGAALYYLHDKRREGEAVRLTSERVAWTHTANLSTADPERAWRIMAHTAMSQAELKRRAGVKATGRKLAKPVYAYSLAWHPEQRPTKDHMISTALGSLEAQGLEQHQAILIAHSDEPQQHVHVYVCRVHPETGKAATLSNNALQLSKWAEAYEKQHGKIYCGKRVENNARRRKGEFVRQPRTPRPVFEFNRATANDHLRRDFPALGQRQQDAHLHEIGRATKRSHARQWRGFARDYREALRTAPERDKDPAEIRDDFLYACAELRDTQGRQRQELRTAWDLRNAERKRALAPFCDHEARRRAGRAYRMGLIRPRHGDERFGPKPPEPDF